MAVETLLVSSLTRPALASQPLSHIQLSSALLNFGDVSHQNTETSSRVEEMGKNSVSLRGGEVPVTRGNQGEGGGPVCHNC